MVQLQQDYECLEFFLCYPWHELWVGKVAETPVVLEPIKDPTRRKNYCSIGRKAEFIRKKFSLPPFIRLEMETIVHFILASSTEHKPDRPVCSGI
jgi:hypothetical protein